MYVIALILLVLSFIDFIIIRLIKYLFWVMYLFCFKLEEYWSLNNCTLNRWRAVRTFGFWSLRWEVHRHDLMLFKSKLALIETIFKSFVSWPVIFLATFDWGCICFPLLNDVFVYLIGIVSVSGKVFYFTALKWWTPGLVLDRFLVSLLDGISIFESWSSRNLFNTTVIDKSSVLSNKIYRFRMLLQKLLFFHWSLWWLFFLSFWWRLGLAVIDLTLNL